MAASGVEARGKLVWEAFETHTRNAHVAWPAAEPNQDECGEVKSLPTTWRERLASLANAFQPIVNIHTGIVLGVESLLRGVQEAGWETPMQLFDEAHAAGLLRPVSRAVRRRAVAAFTNLPFASRVRLFLNVDNRELDDWEALTGNLGDLLQVCGLPLETVCLEVSEKLPAAAGDFLWQRLTAPGVCPHKLAIDDFGAGFSGLKLLYQADPNFIKVDRFFVDGLANDPRKREFVSSVVRLAHVLGVLVIAEGVETLAELRECRAVGCDLVQGHFVQPPTTDLQALRPEYRVVEETSRRDRRQPHRDGDLVASYVEFLPAISIDTEMGLVLQFFRHESSLTFAPVINQHREPLGIIRESDLRQYAYSLYNKDLLRNPRLRSMLPRLIGRCPIADVRLRAEQILGLFSQAGGDLLRRGDLGQRPHPGGGGEPAPGSGVSRQGGPSGVAPFHPAHPVDALKVTNYEMFGRHAGGAGKGG